MINLTQHRATPEQQAAGVVDLPERERAELVELLSFDDLPERDEIARRAEAIADMAAAHGARAAMIGGALWLMSALERALVERGITPCYAFSRRESVEETQPDGSVRKTNIFRHVGFVPAGYQ